MKYYKIIEIVMEIIVQVILFLIVSILFILRQIIKVLIRKPIISLLLIFGIWVNSLPLPNENIVRDDYVRLLGQTQNLDSNAEYQALMGYGQSKILLAADFCGEDGSLDAWKSEDNVDLEPAIQDETQDEDSSYDLYDNIKECDILVGYDSIAEATFLKKLRAGFVPYFRGTPRNLTGLEYAPGLKDDSNRDQQLVQDRRLSVRTEKRFNKRLEKANREKMGLAIKNWQPFYHSYGQLRDKYYHAWVLDKNLPPGLSKTKLKSIQSLTRKEGGYQKRLKMLRENPLISDQDLDRLSGLLREHVINPDTVVIRGTLGANREKRIDQKRLTNPKILLS